MKKTLAFKLQLNTFLKTSFITIWYDSRAQKMFAVFLMLFGAAMAQTANYCAVKTCTGNTLCNYKVSRLAKFWILLL